MVFASRGRYDIGRFSGGMDATILQPEHVRADLCPSVSALWLLLGLH